METKHELKLTDVGERPPFGTWGHWYLAVLLTLAVLVVVFYLFTQAFR